jgi:hypothetical protein
MMYALVIGDQVRCKSRFSFSDHLLLTIMWLPACSYLIATKLVSLVPYFCDRVLSSVWSVPHYVATRYVVGDSNALAT